jgi:hypothetical protein
MHDYEIYYKDKIKIIFFDSWLVLHQHVHVVSSALIVASLLPFLALFASAPIVVVEVNHPSYCFFDQLDLANISC